MEIRFIKESDLIQIKALQPQNWPDIIYYFELYLQSQFCFPICAISHGRIIGVACAILNENSGWLAHIIVAKEHRRKGIGYKLTEYCMNILDEKKCKTQLLIASKEGEMLYPKLGFKKDINYQYYQGTIRTNQRLMEINPFNDSNFNDLKTLEYKITGEKRNLITNDILRKSLIITDKINKKVIAFYIPTFGEGTIISDSCEAGIELLKYKHSLPNRRSVIPENNNNAIKFLNKNGFIKYDECQRMYSGNKLNWKPENIYSRIGGFYG